MSLTASDWHDLQSWGPCWPPSLTQSRFAIPSSLGAGCPRHSTQNPHILPQELHAPFRTCGKPGRADASKEQNGLPGLRAHDGGPGLRQTSKVKNQEVSPNPSIILISTATTPRPHFCESPRVCSLGRSSGDAQRLRPGTLPTRAPCRGLPVLPQL